MRAIAATAALVVLLVTAAVAAPPPDIDGRLAQLSLQQVGRLRKLDIPIILPLHIPKGFRLASLTTGTDEEGVKYALLYRRGSARFWIESAMGGIGDVSGDREIDVKTPLFGGTYLAVTGRNAISGWLGKKPFYHVRAEGVSTDDCIRILKGLRYLGS